MKSKEIQISRNDINRSFPFLEIDASMEKRIDISGQRISQILYPQSIYFHNTSGVDLLYLIISSPQEYFEFQKERNTPGTFPFYKFYIKKHSGSARADIKIYFKNYIEKRYL